jgi:hypothetical protein
LAHLKALACNSVAACAEILERERPADRIHESVRPKSLLKHCGPKGVAAAEGARGSGVLAAFVCEYAARCTHVMHIHYTQDIWSTCGHVYLSLLERGARRFLACRLPCNMYEHLFALIGCMSAPPTVH